MFGTTSSAVVLTVRLATQPCSPVDASAQAAALAWRHEPGHDRRDTLAASRPTSRCQCSPQLGSRKPYEPVAAPGPAASGRATGMLLVVRPVSQMPALALQCD